MLDRLYFGEQCLPKITGLSSPWTVRRYSESVSGWSSGSGSSWCSALAAGSSSASNQVLGRLHFREQGLLNPQHHRLLEPWVGLLNMTHSHRYVLLERLWHFPGLCSERCSGLKTVPLREWGGLDLRLAQFAAAQVLRIQAGGGCFGLASRTGSKPISLAHDR